jgi:hydrogenase maturation protease
MMVIGLGNEFRRDDAVGLIAARRLRERGIPAEEHQGDLATLMEKWKGIDGVILIDAVRSGAAPGTLYCLDASDSPLNREFFKSSTHAFGLADAVELSRTLGTLPRRVLVFGIEVRDLISGVGLSQDVETALPLLVEEVVTAVPSLKFSSQPSQRSIPSPV